MSRAPWYRMFLDGPRSRMVAAAAAVTLISVAVIGSVIVTVTPAGCQLGNRLGVKGHACAQPVASRVTPTPTVVFPTAPATHPPPAPPYTPPASQPYNPPASQPYYPPASQPYNAPGSAPYPSTPIASGTSPYRAQLSCSLPVYASGSGSGGFITFPSGQFIADPKSAVVLPSPGATPQGYGYGQAFGFSYDRAYGKWLAVPFRQVSPDGSHYAFIGTDGIYIVNVASGTPTEVGSGHTWAIVGVTNVGVYGEEQNLAGLTLFAYSGTSTQITSSGFWQAIDGTSAYGTVTSAVPQGVTQTVIKLNMQTGSTTNWFSRQGLQATVVGSDGHGDAVINASGQLGGAGWSNTVWIAFGPNDAQLIAASYAGFSPNGGPIADRNGVWFSGNAGNSGLAIVLYVPGSGLYNVSPIGASLAGTCS